MQAIFATIYNFTLNMNVAASHPKVNFSVCFFLLLPSSCFICEIAHRGKSWIGYKKKQFWPFFIDFQRENACQHVLKDNILFIRCCYCENHWKFGAFSRISPDKQPLLQAVKNCHLAKLIIIIPSSTKHLGTVWVLRLQNLFWFIMENKQVCEFLLREKDTVLYYSKYQQCRKGTKSV